MEAQFNTNELLTKLLAKVILLESQNIILKESFSTFLIKHDLDMGNAFNTNYNRLVKECSEHVLLSYPELNKAFGDDLLKKLGL